LFDRFAGKPVDWDELEETLIRSDIGVPMTLRIIESLRQRGSQISAKEIVEVTRGYIEQILPNANPRLRPLPDRPKSHFDGWREWDWENDFHREACSSAPPRETHCDVGRR